MKPGHRLHALPGVEAEVRLRARREGDDHRLADRPGHAEHDWRRRSRTGRQGRPPAAWSASGWRPWRTTPAGVPAVPRSWRPRTSEATVGTIITPSTRPAASALVKLTSIDRMSWSRRGRHEAEREEPVDDRRDAGQQLHRRLEHLARPGRGVLGEVHRRARARAGPRPERDGGDHQGCRDQGQDGELLRRWRRSRRARPLGRSRSPAGSSAMTMPKVTATESSAESQRTVMMTASPGRGLRLRSMGAPGRPAPEGGPAVSGGHSSECSSAPFSPRCPRGATASRRRARRSAG